MARPGLIIRSQELGGKQVTLGTDASRGIVVEQPSFSSDDWGPSGGTFVLKRNPRVQWPDLRALAPIIVEERGRPVWLGRIKQTPMTDGGTARQVSVVCEGQQFHLDDDVFQRTYVCTDFSKFVDIRGRPETPLTHARVGGQLVIDGGGITLGWENHHGVYGQERIGVVADFSQSAVGIIRCIFQFVCSTGSNNDAALYGYCRLASTDPTTAIGGPLTDVAAYTFPAYLAASGGYQGGNAAAYSSYLNFFAYYSGGTLGAIVGDYSADQSWKISKFACSSDTAWVDGSANSLLKASDVILDAIARGTLKLSTDLSNVATTSFNVPEFDMTGPATPREAISAVNAYHGYQARVRADNRFEYRAYPSTPLLEVGSDSRFDEASAGDASEIYTDVIVEYNDSWGTPQRLKAAQPVTSLQLSQIQPTNPSFDVAPAGGIDWNNTVGGMTRDTGVFDTGPASLRLTPSGVTFYAETVLAGTGWTNNRGFVIRRSYTLSFRVRFDTAIGTLNVDARPYFVPSPVASYGSVAVGTGGATPIGSWFTVSLPFVVTPSAAAASAPYINFRYDVGSASAAQVWIDSVSLLETTPTLVDRWGLRHTKVLATNMALTTAGAQQIADVYLAAHRTTPLKGRLVVVGDGTAKRSRSGQGVKCSELLGAVGELVRMRHLVDPDSGKLGRIGRIAGATWEPETNTATLDIDSTSRNLEAFLARLAIVTGQVRR